MSETQEKITETVLNFPEKCRKNAEFPSFFIIGNCNGNKKLL